MYHHIMVPLDGSKVAECVLDHVVAIGGGRKVSKVTLIRVVVPLHMYGGVESRFSPEDREHLEKNNIEVAGKYLEELVKRLKDKGTAAESEVLYGVVIDKLVDYAHEHEVDLIIIATHGRSGVSRLVLGSVADKILRVAHVPVLMVRSFGEDKPNV